MKPRYAVRRDNIGQWIVFDRKATAGAIDIVSIHKFRYEARNAARELNERTT
jgi:hypothetical protein